MARGSRGNQNQKVVPASKQALDIMKYEVAAELGIMVGQAYSGIGDLTNEFASELGSMSSSNGRSDYWGYIASRDTGAVGGHITRRLIQRAEDALFSLTDD